MKITASIQRDINFYNSIQVELDPPPKTIAAIEKATAGSLSPEEAFAKYDTTGVMKGLKDKAGTLKLFRKKAGANLQIKMWAEGVSDSPPTLPLMEVVEMCIEKGYPDWVLRAIVEQASRIYYERDGWVPSFCTSIPAAVVLDKLKSLEREEAEPIGDVKK